MSYRISLLRSCIRAIAAVVLLCVVAISAHAPAQSAPAYDPGGAVEATYYQPGPSAVAHRTGADCCTSTGDRYDIWYPADLGANGTRHPVITWGDGTLAHPFMYNYLLSHLASWGFVVIAADRTDTGTGIHMLDAVNYLVQQDRDPTSIFYAHIDTDAVGAMGHSQGGLGALNALAYSGGAVKTAVTVEMPSAAICPALPVVAGKSACVDLTTLRTGSVLLVNGTADPISPSAQAVSAQLIGPQSMQGYFDAMPASLPKARAALITASHNDIQGQPGCTNFGCTAGVGGYLGYLTAWFMDRLRGDSFAHNAFVSGSGELAHNPHWADAASNITD